MSKSWKLTKERPCSLSGVRLNGDSLSRHVYLDESGTDIHSSVAIVAAVIIDTDEQWKPVEKYIYGLIEELVPPEIQDGFVFHANDLFHGRTKNIFDKKKYPFEAGPEVLRRMLEIPGKFSLPITFGYVRMREVRKWPDPPPKNVRVIKPDLASECHSEAYVRCVLLVENYMRVIAKSKELAKLIAEDSQPTRKAVEDAHTLLMGQNLKGERAKKFSDLSWSLQGGLPLDRIIGSIGFEKKTDTVLLQLADAVAYTLQRFHEGKPHNQAFVDALTHGNIAPLKRNESADGGNGSLMSPIFSVKNL